VNEQALARLHQRARRVRAAALVRRWEYRQRHHARGVWHRLRRLLSDAREAWSLSAEDASRLITEGFGPEHVGLELEPPLTILVLPEDRLRTLASRRRVALRLGQELLAARQLAIVRWP
jgi:hypothetical protein